jgi:hypothetical protein
MPLNERHRLLASAGFEHRYALPQHAGHQHARSSSSTSSTVSDARSMGEIASAPARAGFVASVGEVDPKRRSAVELSRLRYPPFCIVIP